MIRVGVIVTICHTRDDAKLLTVLFRELTAQTLGRRCQHRVVMMILLTEIIHAITHIGDDLQAQFLTLCTLAVMLARECHQTLSQSDETDTQRTLIDYALDSIVAFQLVSTDPKTLHQQRELLGEGGLLELETVVELLGSHFEHVVKLGKEHVDALLLILFLHTFDGQFHNIDSGKREVTTPDAGLRSKTVLKHTRTTAHRSHLVHIALRIVGSPVAVLIV